MRKRADECAYVKKTSYPDRCEICEGSDCRMTWYEFYPSNRDYHCLFDVSLYCRTKDITKELDDDAPDNEEMRTCEYLTDEVENLRIDKLLKEIWDNPHKKKNKNKKSKK